MNDEAKRRKCYVNFPVLGHTVYHSPSAMSFNPQLIIRKLKRAEFSPESAFVSRAYKELCAYCSFLDTEFAREHTAVEFESYLDLLRSINISASIEAIPSMMFEVLGTVLEEIPERNTSRVYRTPATSRVGEAAHVSETMQAVDALKRARTVFQGDEDGCVLVREADLDEPDEDDA